MTRTNSGVRWRYAVPIAVGLVAGTYMLSNAVPRLAAQAAGVEGAFSATRCTEERDSDGDLHWMCEGSFAAGDGSFAIPRVEVDTAFDTRPDGPTTAFVLGPSSGTAVRPGVLVWLGPGAVGALSLALPVWALRRGRKGARNHGEDINVIDDMKIKRLIAEQIGPKAPPSPSAPGAASPSSPPPSPAAGPFAPSGSSASSALTAGPGSTDGGGIPCVD
ncbi:hypothetical protein [Streptomyces sp. NPDC048349]|uniref:hypothetical protein n=1 Tax=Streptomyces sp. NPDC048349 TaxID=3155486 RepID=UPI003419BC6F